MTLCVIDGKQCQCQPDEGVPCVEGTPAQVQAAMWDEVMKYRKDAERYRWLREQCDTQVNLVQYRHDGAKYLYTCHSARDMDEAVDAGQRCRAKAPDPSSVHPAPEKPLA